MSELRERIIKEIRDYDESLTISALGDAVLAVVTAHMTVTDEDATAVLKDFYGDHYAVASIEFDPFKRRDMKAALEAFVSSKLKGEPK